MPLSVELLMLHSSWVTILDRQHLNPRQRPFATASMKRFGAMRSLLML